MNPSTHPDRPAQHTVLIGGASGFWGDSQMAVPQLLQQPGLQYLVFDYLAETTMSILQRARLRSPELGYATDFVTAAVGPHLRDIRDKGVRLVSNAGGLHPAGCRDAILALAREQGVQVKVAIVTGDDVLDRQQDFEPWQQEPLPAQLPPLMSASAYLGAGPIARALDGGADIVVTGRCVDSAALLGIAIHELAGALTTTTAWPRPAWPATWSSAAPRPRAACSPTGSPCPTGPTSAIRWCACRPMAASSCSSPHGAAAWSRARPWASNCSTR